MMPFKAKIGFQPSSRPRMALEISPEGVMAAALQLPGQAPAYACEPLPSGAVVPSVSEPNLRSLESVIGAIRSTLERVAQHSRFLTLILPDAAVRVFLLSFASLPDKAGDALAVLRFRLRKVVPFDVEKATVGYQVLSRDEAACKVLTAVIPAAVLKEYETAVIAAGYQAGMVLPSSLAALEGLDSQEPVLAACLSGSSLTTSIAQGEDMLLYRTLDLPQDPDKRLAEVQRDIAVATAYFEDQLTSRPPRLYYCGMHATETFAEWVSGLKLPVVEIAPKPRDSGAALAQVNASIAGVTGALAALR